MQTKTQDPDMTPTLTNALLEDLLNPSISALDLCNDHQLTLPKLVAIISSEQFEKARECIEQISAARQSLIEPEARTAALSRLTDLLKDKPETEKHAETLRKAASKLLTNRPPRRAVKAPAQTKNTDHPPTPRSTTPKAFKKRRRKTVPNRVLRRATRTTTARSQSKSHSGDPASQSARAPPSHE